MLFKWTRLAPLARHIAVASMSLLLVASTIGYVFSPVEEALAANVSTMVTKGHPSVEGRIQGKHKGVVIRIAVRRRGHLVILRTVKPNRDGRFHVAVKPGRYIVVIQDGRHRVTTRVKVTKGHSDFFVVKVVKKRGGFGIAPVVFNY